MMLALWMAVTCLRPPFFANSKAYSAIRMDATRVITFKLVTTSFTTSCSRPEYKSSVFSRKITMSISTSSKRVFNPGSECTGRTLANRSKCLRSATLTLGNPPPMGVVTGPLRPTLVRSIDSMTWGGSTWPDFDMMLAFKSARCQSMATPVALTARMVASATSGPMPSPGINVTE